MMYQKLVEVEDSIYELDEECVSKKKSLQRNGKEQSEAERKKNDTKIY